MEEIWKDVLGYENLYQVSNFGNVRSLNYRNTKKIKNLSLVKNGKERNSDNYYLAVNLKNNNNEKTYKVHRLVLMSFLEKSNFEIDHINGIKYDNRLENLRYCSSRQNRTFAVSKFKNKSSKYIGVHFDKKAKKYQSRIRLNKKRISLGYFENEEEASKAYQKALNKIE